MSQLQLARGYPGVALTAEDVARARATPLHRFESGEIIAWTDEDGCAKYGVVRECAVSDWDVSTLLVECTPGLTRTFMSTEVMSFTASASSHARGPAQVSVC